MNDQAVIDLYWKRDESAIRETDRKYSRYLVKIAYHVLADTCDCEESLNDTYLKTWNSLPPHRPEILSAYLAKIMRWMAIDMRRKKSTKKRGNSEYVLSLSELGDCVSGEEGPQQRAEFLVLEETISEFLKNLPMENSDIFVCRYFYMDSIQEIAAYSGYSESKIKSMLYRMRNGLKNHLEKEGFTL